MASREEKRAKARARLPDSDDEELLDKDCPRWIHQGKCAFGKDCRYKHDVAKQGLQKRKSAEEQKTEQKQKEQKRKEQKQQQQHQQQQQEQEQESGAGGPAKAVSKLEATMKAGESSGTKAGETSETKAADTPGTKKMRKGMWRRARREAAEKEAAEWRAQWAAKKTRLTRYERRELKRQAKAKRAGELSAGLQVTEPEKTEKPEKTRKVRKAQYATDPDSIRRALQAVEELDQLYIKRAKEAAGVLASSGDSPAAGRGRGKIKGRGKMFDAGVGDTASPSRKRKAPSDVGDIPRPERRREASKHAGNGIRPKASVLSDKKLKRQQRRLLASREAVA